MSRHTLRRPALLVVTILLAVIGVDQATKAWAWRSMVDVHINSGGDLLVGSGIGSWFRDPVRGAMFDVTDAVLLVTALVLFARRPRVTAVAASSVLVLAGWSSNLLDRLGMHYWTAPGSVRGVVDFVPWNGRYWNVADLAIICGSVSLLVSLAVTASRAVARRGAALAAPAGHRLPAVLPVVPWRLRPRLRELLPSARARLAAAGGIVTATVLAAIGVVAYAGVTGPTLLLAAR